MAVYYLYALLTLPGVVLHELAHAFFCWLAKVKIHKIVLFRFGNPAGYVAHQEPAKFYQSFFISFGPLIINSFAAMILFAGLQQPWKDYHNAIFLWLAVVFALHAIPSEGDAATLWQIARRRVWRNPFILIGFPAVVMLYLLNFLKRWHIHFVYVGVLAWLALIFLKK